VSGLARAILGLGAVALTLGAASPALARTPVAPVPAPAPAAGPLVWTAPAPVDASPIDALACPSASLCVAADRSGDVLSSTDPAAGHGWQLANVDGNVELTGIACPSVSLCVATDAAGNVVTSQSPAAGAWTVTPVDPTVTQSGTDTGGSVLLRGVACPAITLCVAVDAAGNALSSTNPGAGAPWSLAHVDADTSYGCTGAGLVCQPPLTGIACPSVALCAAVDFAGNVLTSTAPAGGLTPWLSVPTRGGGLASLWGISCPTATMCATVDGYDGDVITFNPAAPSVIVTHVLPLGLFGIWCPTAQICLASAATSDGTDELAGSSNANANEPRWSLSALGGINAVACPTPEVCLAADDEGNIAAGATVTSVTAALDSELLSSKTIPRIGALVKDGGYRFHFTSPIAATLAVTWQEPSRAAAPVVLATSSVHFTGPAARTVGLPLTGAGRRLLKGAGGRVRVRAVASFTTSTGTVTAQRTLTLVARPARRRARK
jgi:hypothetical protein